MNFGRNMKFFLLLLCFYTCNADLGFYHFTKKAPNGNDVFDMWMGLDVFGYTASAAAAASPSSSDNSALVVSGAASGSSSSSSSSSSISPSIASQRLYIPLHCCPFWGLTMITSGYLEKLRFKGNIIPNTTVTDGQERIDRSKDSPQDRLEALILTLFPSRAGTSLQTATVEGDKLKMLAMLLLKAELFRMLIDNGQVNFDTASIKQALDRCKDTSQLLAQQHRGGFLGRPTGKRLAVQSRKSLGKELTQKVFLA